MRKVQLVLEGVLLVTLLVIIYLAMANSGISHEDLSTELKEIRQTMVVLNCVELAAAELDIEECAGIFGGD